MTAYAGVVGWILGVYGFTLVVTESEICRPLRRRLDAAGRIWRMRRSHGGRGKSWIGKLVHCSMCFGWWAGLLFALLGLPLEPLGVLGSAFAASGTCWLLHLLADALYVLGTPWKDRRAE